MARLFDDASTEYLEIDQAVLAGVPLAMACFFNTDDLENSQCLISILDKDVDNQFFALQITASDDRVRATTQDAFGGYSAVTTGDQSANTWHHACGLFVATDDRRVFFDGGSKGTNSGDATPLNLDRTSIGRLGRATPALYMSGMIAEVAIWDLSDWPGATASDKADVFERIVPSLAKGLTPNAYPSGLVPYWDLIRSLNDRVGGYNLTASGTVVSAHPRIIQPCGIL